MRRFPGVVIGIVRSLDDPDNEGRIEVEFPWLAQEERSGWAPIATLMAGGDRGAFFMPETGDEVLVAFEHGDFDHPFVVGFLWNGAQRPPHSDINSSVRRLRTVSGHRVEFNDNEGQEQILVITAGGQEIRLKDVPAEVAIKTAGGNEITISDSPPGITLSVPCGSVSVNCVRASLSSSASLEVSSPMTVFRGVVQVPILIAQSVVGSAYTPAPGNTFGS